MPIEIFIILILSLVLVALPLGIFIFIVIVKKANDFKEKAKRVKKNMTLKEAISIMGRPADIKKHPMYKWEKSYYHGFAFATNYLYIFVVIDEGVITAIDKNF